MRATGLDAVIAVSSLLVAGAAPAQTSMARPGVEEATVTLAAATFVVPAAPEKGFNFPQWTHRPCLRFVGADEFAATR